MTPRQAFFAPREQVPFAAAVGRVSAELIAPYPPGIPALAPGEVVSAELVAALQGEAAAGTRMAGVSDTTLAALFVVA
jgi:arginine decarboxylase